MSSQPVLQLINELKSDDINSRINSIENLNTISLALGKERTRKELLPFLFELLDDDEEILIAMAKSLSMFVDSIGGPQYAQLLFPILENICKVSESFVREQGVIALQKILEVTDFKKLEDSVLQLMKRFATSDYPFVQQQTAILIITVINKSSKAFQSQYITLVKNENSCVRKQAAISLPVKYQKNQLIYQELIKKSTGTYDKEICDFFNLLIKDEHDFVRLQLVHSLYAFNKPSKQLQEILLKYYQQLSEDSSWRTKYLLVENFIGISKVFDKEIIQRQCLDTIVKFASNDESELRGIVSLKISEICQNLSLDVIITRIAPLLKSLASDSQPFVRDGLAGSLLQLSSLAGKKYVNDLIIPSFLILLKDSESDIRIKLLNNLNELANIMGIDTLQQSIFPSLQELASDKVWRIRQTTITLFSFFAKQLGIEFFSEKIIQLIKIMLTDQVYAVRNQIIITLVELQSILGNTWFEKNIIPLVNETSRNNNYLYRQVFLFVIQKSVSQLTKDYFFKQAIPILVELAKDKVPNIRSGVAKTINICVKYQKEGKEQMKKILISLQVDQDKDVLQEVKTALIQFQ